MKTEAAFIVKLTGASREKNEWSIGLSEHSCFNSCPMEYDVTGIITFPPFHSIP